jgi:hypothetical protein
VRASPARDWVSTVPPRLGDSLKMLQIHLDQAVSVPFDRCVLRVSLIDRPDNAVQKYERGRSKTDYG